MRRGQPACRTVLPALRCPSQVYVSGLRRRLADWREVLSGMRRPVNATPSPASYTPRHLSEQILSLRGVIEGERKQVTVLFCDIVESTSRAASLGPEGFHELVDRFSRKR